MSVFYNVKYDWNVYYIILCWQTFHYMNVSYSVITFLDYFPNSFIPN